MYNFVHALPQAYQMSFVMSMTCERREWEIGNAQNIPSFILHLQQLDKMLATAGKIADSTLNACLEICLREFDRAEKTQLLQDTMQNKMHVYGMGLCVLASRYMGDNEGDNTHPRSFHQQDKLERYMSKFYQKLVFVNKKSDHFEFEDVHTLICSIQLHFEEMYVKEKDETSNTVSRPLKGGHAD